MASPEVTLGTLPGEEIAKAASDFGVIGDAMSGSAVASALTADLRAWQQHSLRDAAIHFWLYKANPWVRTCVDLIAQRATADEYTLESKSGDETGVEALRVFLSQINPSESLDRLLRGIYRDLEINGNWYGRVQYMEHSGAQSGAKTSPVVAVYRIDFRVIAPVPVESGPVEEYALFKNGRSDLSPQHVPAREILHITLNDAGENGTGLSELESLDFTLANDQAAIAYNTGFFQNGAKAGDIYQMDPALGPDQVEGEREYLKENFTKPSQSFEPLLLQGNTKLLRDGSTIRKDMDFVKLREWNREETTAVMSVPLSLVTGQVGSLGANGKEQDNIVFKEAVIAPLQKQVFEDLNRQLIVGRMGNTDLVLIPPKIAGIRLDLVNAAEVMIKSGATGNEARGVMRLEPFEGMDRPLFLGGRTTSLIGVPGDDESILLTTKGAVSARVLDPSEGAAPENNPAVEGTQGGGETQDGGTEQAPSTGLVRKAGAGAGRSPESLTHEDGAPQWLIDHADRARRDLDEWNADFASRLVRELRNARKPRS